MNRPQGFDRSELVQVPAESVVLTGSLAVPDVATGAVLFAHGSGSGRRSPRNRFVAQQLNEAGLATLLIDLLTEGEESVDQYSGHLRFNIPFLAGRLLSATNWLIENPSTAGMKIGYFGASTGAAAALVAAATRPKAVGAVVSRGGRPDLAGNALAAVEAPTLLIVGGDDEPVIELNQDALKRLRSPVKKLVIVPGASHLFEESGKLEDVAQLAGDWFVQYLAATTQSKES